MEFAKAYYHWFFLIQPFDMPERLIGADPVYYLRRKTSGWGSAGGAFFDPRAFAEYERCFADPATIHATCEDYRAAASIDLEHDDEDVAAGRKLACPLLVLWGEKGVVERCFDPARGLAQRGRRCARADAAHGALPRRGGAGGNAGGTGGVLRLGRGVAEGVGDAAWSDIIADLAK